MSNGIQQTFVTRLTDVQTASEGAKERLGAIRFDDGKIYKYVQYNGGAGSIAAVAGRVAALYAPGGASAGATTVVTMDTSDGSEVGAGMLLAVIPHLGFGWIQIKGLATMTTAFTAGADGDPMTLTGATADAGNLDVSAAVTDHVCAISVDASAFIILLDCPF